MLQSLCVDRLPVFTFHSGVRRFSFCSPASFFAVLLFRRLRITYTDNHPSALPKKRHSSPPRRTPSSASPARTRKIKRYGWIPDIPDQRDFPLRRATRLPSCLAAQGRPTNKVPAGLRPGSARKLHRQRHRRRARVRSDERAAPADLRSLASLHLL